MQYAMAPRFSRPRDLSDVRRHGNASFAGVWRPTGTKTTSATCTRTRVGNKAFSLMVQGGTHFGFGIPKVAGWDTSTKIWYRAMTSLPARATFLQAAESQVVESRRFGTDAFRATACAWISVGVLPAERLANAKARCQETLELGKVAPPTEGCSGIEDGFACNPSAPFSGFVCKQGSIAGGIACRDTSKRCRRAGSTDPRASVDASGHLVCD